MDGSVEEIVAALTPIPTTARKDTMRLLRTVVVVRPLSAAVDYLSDSTTTTQWDPGTLTTVRQHDNSEVGTTYLNTSTFLGRNTRLTYVVDEFVDRQHIRLRGETRPSSPWAP